VLVLGVARAEAAALTAVLAQMPLQNLAVVFALAKALARELPQA